MTQKIIDYYNSELRVKVIVAKYKVFWKRFIFILFLAYLFSSGFLLVNFNFFVSHEWYLIGSVIVWGIGFAPILFSMQYSNTQAIKKTFPDMYVSRFLWSNIKFRRMVKAKLKEKLLELEIKNKDQVKQVSDLVKSKANNERIPYILSATTFGILFTPIWYGFINKTFDIYKDQFPHLLALFIGGIMLIITISILAPMLIDIRDSVLTKYNDLNNLGEYLDDIHMEL